MSITRPQELALAALLTTGIAGCDSYPRDAANGCDVTQKNIAGKCLDVCTKADNNQKGVRQASDKNCVSEQEACVDLTHSTEQCKNSPSGNGGVLPNPDGSGSTGGSVLNPGPCEVKILSGDKNGGFGFEGVMVDSNGNVISTPYDPNKAVAGTTFTIPNYPVGLYVVNGGNLNMEVGSGVQSTGGLLHAQVENDGNGFLDTWKRPGAASIAGQLLNGTYGASGSINNYYFNPEGRVVSEEIPYDNDMGHGLISEGCNQ